MTDAIETLLAIIAVLLSLAFALFCIAWVTVLPTIGLLYWFGYLS